MLFFFKKSKIVVDCFTNLRGVYEVYPIKNSMEFYPSEFSKIGSYYTNEDPNLKIRTQVSTIKRCVGIIDYYKTGFIMPMWSDFICQPQSCINGESVLGAMSMPFTYGPHPPEQYQGTGIFSDYFHIKFDSPWYLREKTGVKFTWNQPTWNLSKYSNNFIVVPGTVSYDIQASTHLNMFINKKSEDFTIMAGTPMVHFAPQTDKEVVIKNHLVTTDELLKVGMPKDFNWLLPNRYTRYKNLMKNKNKGKCPFGFGK